MRIVDNLAVGVDFDGTLADTNTFKTGWIIENLGLEVPPHLCDATSCIPIIGREDYRRLGDSAYSRETTLNVPPLPGALDVIRRLREIGEVAVITARTGERLSSAEVWLSQFEETRGMRIIGLDTKAAPKLMRCSEEGIGVLIDDDERHLLRNGPVRSILFKQDAPEGFTASLTICRSWVEIGRVLETPE